MTSKGQRSNYGTLRNHIIPMFHMRNFARKTDDRDVVYLYDLEEARTEHRYHSKQFNVKNAAVQKGFYTNEYESELADEYESPSVEPIRKLITGPDHNTRRKRTCCRLSNELPIPFPRYAGIHPRALRPIIGGIH